MPIGTFYWPGREPLAPLPADVLGVDGARAPRPWPIRESLRPPRVAFAASAACFAVAVISERDFEESNSSSHFFITELPTTPSVPAFTFSSMKASFALTASVPPPSASSEARSVSIV